MTMSWYSRIVGLLILGLAILVPALAADKDDAKDKDKDTGPKEKRITVSQVSGKVSVVESSGKKFKLSLPIGGGRYMRWQDIDIEATDDVKVRVLNPPTETDEKGRPKRLTSAELKKLKGPDPRLPGYNAEFDNLRQGMIVQVTLSKRKEAPKPMVRRKKGDDDDLAGDNRPMASLIVILADPPPAR
jgi:hypothetical protein